jgi:acetyl esterase/lipase
MRESARQDELAIRAPIERRADVAIRSLVSLRMVFVLLIATLLVGCACERPIEPPLPGVFAQTIEIELGGDATKADVYRPEAAPVQGVVLLAHGFGRDRATLAALALDLARAGFAVVVPDLPYLADHSANGRFLSALASAIARPTQPELELGAGRIMFAGFSAGGLASLVAAASRGDTAAWIGLDPVDRDGVGTAAAEHMMATAFVIRAAPSACNAESNFAPALSRLPRLALDRIEPGASHCDFEAPTNIVCTLVCGRVSPERQSAIRAFVIAAARSIVAR